MYLAVLACWLGVHWAYLTSMCGIVEGVPAFLAEVHLVFVCFLAGLMFCVAVNLDEVLQHFDVFFYL